MEKLQFFRIENVTGEYNNDLMPYFISSAKPGIRSWFVFNYLNET